jgi:hypothetical protein
MDQKVNTRHTSANSLLRLPRGRARSTHPPMKG